MTGTTNDNECLDHCSGNFVCGVVEGFYGRPWTTDQRRLLFQWMQKMGMNTYMYAPKDDYKHRAFWRDLYSVEEADNLTSLIASAEENGVRFVYAISPGLDITFSNSKDVLALKRKLEQVSTFGCKAFALLFDDINPEMGEADKGAFQTTAHAQVSVSNEVYQHLAEPVFLFCPTEYCSARALPTVSNSEYLNTIGSRLLPGIEIMWTGQKVVSRRLTIQSLEEIARVLKRPPLIWDNIHANDYDPKRLFLGPYDGRSPEIIPYLRGVLTNPNCEFEANFVAFHTLSQWSKSNLDGVKKDIINNSDRLSPVTSDIKLETEIDFASDADIPAQFDMRYQPRTALHVALSEWIAELSMPRIPTILNYYQPINEQFVGPLSPSAITPPHPGEVAHRNLAVPDISVDNHNIAFGSEASVNDSAIQPKMTPVNSLVDSVRLHVSVQHNGDHSNSSTLHYSDNSELEPMDYIAVPDSSPIIPHIGQLSPISNNPSSSELDKMQVDGESDSESESLTRGDMTNNLTAAIPDNNVTVENLQLLVDLFYMPFEHGSASLKMLLELNWLQSNAHMMTHGARNATHDDATEWQRRAELFYTYVQDVNLLIKRLVLIPNKSLLRDVLPYMWDIKGVLAACDGYIKWLDIQESIPYIIKYMCSWSVKIRGLTELMHTVPLRSSADLPSTSNLETDNVIHFINSKRRHFFRLSIARGESLRVCFSGSDKNRRLSALGHVPYISVCHLQGAFTWFTKGYKEDFMSGEREPWMFRGGLQGEFHRLLPLEAAPDLFICMPPCNMQLRDFVIRPFKQSDEMHVYSVCRQTCNDGMDATDVFSDLPDLVGDRIIGGLLELSPEYCFVVEGNTGVYGYSLAALDAKACQKQLNVAWIPSMREKYAKSDKEVLSPPEDMIASFHAEQVNVPDGLIVHYPSLVRLNMLSVDIDDFSIAKRLLTCTLAALKTNGSIGVHCVLGVCDKNMLDFYSKLGFCLVGPPPETHDVIMYMGRIM